MGTYPALYVRPPEDPTQQIERGASLLGMLQQQKQARQLYPIQVQQQQEALKGQQLENQQKQIQMMLQKSLADLYANKAPQPGDGSQQSGDSATGTSTSTPDSSSTDDNTASTAAEPSDSTLSPAGQLEASEATGNRPQATGDSESAPRGPAATPPSNTGGSAGATRTSQPIAGGTGQPGSIPQYQPPSDQEILRVVGPYGLPVIKSMKDLQKTNADLQKAQDEHQSQALDYMANLSYAIKQAGSDSSAPNGWNQEKAIEAARTLLQHAAGSGFQNEAAMLWARIQANPLSLQPIVDNVISMSPKQRELAAQESQIPGHQAENTQKQLTTMGQVLGNATDQQSWDARLAFLKAQGYPDGLLSLVPQQYSADAATQIKNMAVSPEKLASMPDAAQYINNYLKANNLADTPANRLAAHADYIQKTKVVPQVTVLNATNPMAGAPSGGGAPAGGGNVPASGEDSLAGMTPNQQELVRGVANYTIDPAQYKSNRNPKVEADLIAAAKRYNPNYDQTAYAEKNKLRRDIATQSTALNTATHHLDLLSQAADALDNHDMQALNLIGNAYHVQMGADAQTNFEAIKTAVSGELSKVFKGGQATDAEIAQANATLNRNMSPAQLRGAINSYTKLMQGRLQGLEETYEGQIGVKPNFRIVSPRAQQIFDRAGGTQSGGVQVTLTNGQTATFPDQASANRFKKDHPDKVK